MKVWTLFIFMQCGWSEFDLKYWNTEEECLRDAARVYQSETLCIEVERDVQTPDSP